MKRTSLHSVEPSSARKKIAAAKSNKPFMAALLDRDHRGHRDAVDQWTRLHEAGFPPAETSPSGQSASVRQATSRQELPVARARPGMSPIQLVQQGQGGVTAGPQFRQIDPYPGGPQGPIITFENDDPTGGQVDLPVREELVDAVEAAAQRVGLNVNINSTRRTNSTPHGQGRAIDINRINGMRVDDPQNQANVDRLQREFMSLPNVNQVLGPVHNVNIDAAGRQTPVRNQTLIDDHRNHIHINVRR